MHAVCPSNKNKRDLFWCTTCQDLLTDNPIMLPFQHGCHQVSSSLNCTSLSFNIDIEGAIKKTNSN